MKRGKKYLAALEKIELHKKHTLEEAVLKLKEVAFAKFDETVEVAVRLGVDPRHADQMVRGAVVLPNGLGKNVRVLVFAKGEKEKKDDDDIEIKDFLRISEITSVRREMFRGHEVVAFDFEPRKGFKPKNRAEDIVNKLAGTIWVDETARQVARLEARLTDSYKNGGGMLASIGASTAFSFEQEKVGDEVWLPSSMEANISARVLLLAKFNRSVERRYSDYKKYQIDSKYDLTKPKENAKPQ